MKTWLAFTRPHHILGDLNLRSSSETGGGDTSMGVVTTLPLTRHGSFIVDRRATCGRQEDDRLRTLPTPCSGAAWATSLLWIRLHVEAQGRISVLSCWPADHGHTISHDEGRNSLLVAFVSVGAPHYAGPEPVTSRRRASLPGNHRPAD